MAREIKAVENMSRRASDNVKRDWNSSTGHGGGGIMRELMVVTRELASGRGLNARTAGSITILLQRLGLLNLVTKDATTSSRLLADAWAAQSEKAGTAAVAATRKAAASMAAFAADESNTEATLAQAIADEEGAAAAILNAKATQAKAVAASEAAESAGAASAASIGVVGAALFAVAAVAAVVWANVRGMKEALKGFELPEAHTDYIAKGSRTADQWANAQAKVTDEVARTVEKYHEAAAAAERVSDATKEHFDHLQKMASFEKDPQVRAQKELEVERQRGNAALGNKIAEKSNLEIQARNKSSEAQKLFGSVLSEREEAEHAKLLKQRADAAHQFIKDEEAGKGHASKAAAILFGGGANLGAIGAVKSAFGMKGRLGAVNASITQALSEANRAIQVEKDFADKEQERKKIREKASSLMKQSEESASEAAKIGLDIPNMQKANAQRLADKAEEMQAEGANVKGRVLHGNVNELQRIGAYTQAASTHVDIAKSQLNHLKSIDARIAKVEERIGRPNYSGVNFGSF